MIHVKLDQVAKRLHRSISDIARETGINRNTITSLYHGKVEGVRFSTLQTLCDTYFLELKDLLEYLPPDRRPSVDQTVPMYKQEGEIVPFTCWPWMLAALRPVSGGGRLGRLECYFRHDHGIAYWEYRSMYEVARQVYDRYHEPVDIQRFYGQFSDRADRLEELYFAYEAAEVLALPPSDLKKLFQETVEIYGEFWDYSLFLDAFEAGFDQEEIARLADRYHLDVDEVGLLTTPAALTYTDERRLAFLKAFQHDRGDLGGEAVSAFRKRYDCYASTYATIRHIDLLELEKMAAPYASDGAALRRAIGELEALPGRQQLRINKVLRKHGLQMNPLAFFQELTYWREYKRRTANQMGIHVLDMILSALEERTGIAKKYLRYLSFDEFDSALKRLVGKEALMKRYQQGILVSLSDGDYILSVGEEAAALRKELEQSVEGEGIGQVRILGETGSPGYARGIARILKEPIDLGKLQEGNILFASTFEEWMVPGLRKAAAFVFEEGVASPAAAAAREWGKACIVGVKNPLNYIQEGDLVEVRGNHATVRLITTQKTA